MDRAKLLALSFLVSLSFLACSSPNNFENQVFPQTQGACQSDAVKNRYVVKRLDGVVSVVQANSREEMLTNYVRPHLTELSYVEPDYLIHLNNEKLYSTSTPNSQTWGPDRIGAAQAWSAGYNGQGITVAVVDSGVDVTHPSLASEILPGWNFTNNSATFTYLDQIAHGTHVSGIIAAAHSSSNPMEGIAPQAKILPLQFIQVMGTDQYGYPIESGYTSDAINAIEYAKSHGAQIINASWGSSSCSQLLQQEIQSLEGANILFVSAAGNSGNDLARYPEYPAAIDAVTQLTVGAITINGIMAAYSNYGQPVDLMAPGSGILSTVPGNQYEFMDGTSMATPMVSGVAALLLSANPKLTATQLKALISQSVLSGNFAVRTHGEVNIPNALQMLSQY